MSQDAGAKAEGFFIELLQKCNVAFEKTDDWYDFTVEGFKVEVKSTKLSRGNGTHLGKEILSKQHTIGRFDFTDPENREHQFDDNVWVALIVRHWEQYILVGFLKAKQLEKKRYLSLHKAIELEPLNLEQWLLCIRRRMDMDSTQICYWDKISRSLKGSILAKARKFNRLHLIEEKSPGVFHVKPIEGYNKSTYVVKVRDGEPYDCNCQYANPLWAQPEDTQPVCSHKAGVALHIRNHTPELQVMR